MIFSNDLQLLSSLLIGLRIHYESAFFKQTRPFFVFVRDFVIFLRKAPSIPGPVLPGKFVHFVQKFVGNFLARKFGIL